MKVRDLMATSVACCGPRTNGAALAEIFWSKDCGSIPIVDEKNRLLGIVTDRDLSIALGTRNVRPSDLAAEHVMSTDVVSCGLDDDVKQALGVMQTRRIRRVPVVDRDRTLRGVLSLDDVIRQAARGTNDVSPSAVVSVLARIIDRTPSKEPGRAAVAV